MLSELLFSVKSSEASCNVLRACISQMVLRWCRHCCGISCKKISLCNSTFDDVGDDVGVVDDGDWGDGGSDDVKDDVVVDNDSNDGDNDDDRTMVVVVLVIMLKWKDHHFVALY